MGSRLPLLSVLYIGVLAENASPFLLGIRNTSYPRLAYSTWVGWYLQGGLNETVLYEQALAMSTQLKPFGWNLLLHDYGWAVCGSTFDPQMGCVRVDPYGRLFPDGERYPSSALPGGRDGDFKPFTDRLHALGLGFGLHLIHGIPKLAVRDALPIAGSAYTAADIADRGCSTFIPDNFAVNASHPGAQAYYDSVVAKFAQWGIDFVYFDGVPDCGECHLGELRLLADAASRLGNGLFIYMSYGSSECPAAEVFAAGAAYARLACDTVDSWPTLLANWEAAAAAAPLTGPGRFGDLASLMVGAVHRNGGAPGPDYVIPSPQSSLTEDEVVGYASLVAMSRSTWWPSGALDRMTPFMASLLTNTEVLRVSMASSGTRLVALSAESGHVWASEDKERGWTYVLLGNPGNSSYSKNATVGATLSQLGVNAASCQWRDLWLGEDLGRVAGSVGALLRPHAAVLGRLSNCSGSTSN